jgi:hypothetical protein
MRKVKRYMSCLCLIAMLAVAVPAIASTQEGPQGGSNSTSSAPPPPSSGTLGKLVAAVISLLI